MTITSPVSGDDFFGQEKTLEVLDKRVDSFCGGYRQNLAMIGSPHIGKTSIMFQYLKQMKHANIVPIYVDVSSASLSECFEHFIKRLIYGYLKGRCIISAYDSLSYLLEKSEPLIPITTEKAEQVLALLKKGRRDLAFSRLLELTYHFYKEAQILTLVILDEFHRLEDYGLKSSYQTFGRQIMVQKNSMYVLISSSEAIAQEILNKKLSLLFGNFEKIVVSPFSFAAAATFVKRRLEPCIVPEISVKYLINLTDGHPFYLNLICESMRQIAQSTLKTTIDKSILIEALKNELFEAGGVLNQHCTQLIARWSDIRSRGNHMAILHHIASGKSKVKDLSQLIRRSVRETSRQLGELVEAELLYKNGVFYHFSDQMLKFWVTNVFKIRDSASVADMKEKASHFVSCCIDDIDAFSKESDKTELERIKDLLSRFENDTIEWGSKGKRLPAFDEVFDAADPSSKDVILARGGRNRWICSISRGKVTVESLKKTEDAIYAEHKNAKKIMITLGGMDQNAKLMAKNSRIWTLSLKKINALMEFYGKSKIVNISK